jgi:hypothetical protein
MTDNVVPLRPVPDDAAEHLAGAMAEAAAEALTILDGIPLELLVADLRFLATCGEYNAAVLLSTIATDLDLVRHALPSVLAETVAATKGAS